MKTKHLLDVAERDARSMFPYIPTWHELRDIFDAVTGFNLSMGSLDLAANRLEARMRKSRNK